MSKYFSIALMGAGTWEVESFRHYIARLADAHSLTPTQFIRHVQAWWQEIHPGEPDFPAYIYHAKGAPICGYGRDVARSVTIMEEATGQEGLRAGTLCALQNAAAPSRPHTLKQWREWCPVCFKDDLETGEAYERLVWLIEGFSRCPIHKVELHRKCPHCGSLQAMRAGTRVDECESCGDCLCVRPRKMKRVVHPAFAEGDIIAMVQLFASNPYFEVSGDVYEFFDEAWNAYRPYLEKVVESCHLERSVQLPELSRRNHPTISTMIKIARLTDVPLSLILEEPEYASRLFLSTTLALPETPFAWHRLHGRKTHQAISRHLRNAVSEVGTGKLYDLEGSLRKKGVSLGYARYWFPEYVQQLTSANKALKEKKKAAHIESVRKSIKRHRLMERYIAGKMNSQDEIVAFLTEKTSAPVWIVRNEVQLACRKALFLREAAEWAASEASMKVLGAARLDRIAALGLEFRE